MRFESVFGTAHISTGSKPAVSERVIATRRSHGVLSHPSVCLLYAFQQGCGALTMGWL
jgi:hypothetical protein